MILQSNQVHHHIRYTRRNIHSTHSICFYQRNRPFLVNQLCIYSPFDLKVKSVTQFKRVQPALQCLSIALNSGSVLSAR